MYPSLVILIPVRDEAPTLAPLLRDLLQVLGEVAEILVIDDGSIDGSGDIARALGVKVVRHATGRGYGASLKTGLAASSAPRVAIIDGDGTYDAIDLARLQRALPTRGMVVGARAREHSACRRLCKRLFCLQVRLLTGHRVADLNSGMRIFDRRLAERLARLLPDRFSFTTTLTLGALALGTPVRFVDVAYRPRDRGQSKFLIADVLRFARTVARGCGWIRRRALPVLADACPLGLPSASAANPTPIGSAPGQAAVRSAQRAPRSLGSPPPSPVARPARFNA